MFEDKDFHVADDSQKWGCWCVAVARNENGVAVRSSKDPNGPTLHFNNNEWQAFLNGVKKGEFNPIGPVDIRLT
ncbi:MAG: DUF397 domain-containing protein [Candidatus Zambryskibacteria bacterium]|nr:DUF397 domain-containing protein [Candidatus Zambryskibacteria bacterium]